jgi:uncharacterized protein YbjT (DUF2867 family)
MRIVLIGGTGLVGALLGDRLLAAGESEIHAILRRPTERNHAAWHEYLAPIADWSDITSRIGAEVAISALGTTMRAAGSQGAFRAVDFDAVVAFARAARAAGARHMVTVSSVGAESGSRNFYLKLKGEMEAALEALGFDRLDIFRPGLLRGPRGGERRLGERLGIFASPVVNLVLQGPLDCYAAIDAVHVADAMVAVLKEERSGVHVHENRAIRALARR